jgi:1-Cys peroxiredoxin 6
MPLKLGDEFPSFHVKTTLGDIQLHDWIGDRSVSVHVIAILYDQFSSWCIFFSHPADFTPVCTTELSRAAKLKSEFARRNVKCIALSCDSIENHREWIKANI